MKVSICEEEKIEQLEVVILCQKRTSLVDQLAKRIGQAAVFIVGKGDEGAVQLPIDDIYYIEAVENRTYVYGEERVYSADMKLYELEARLTGTTFQRISKSCILNLDKMKSAKGMINGRLMIELNNQERLIVNRSYVQKLKEHVMHLYA